MCTSGLFRILFLVSNAKQSFFDQVANMADCMKIAIDFVSPENIDRCEKLTKEFREQNQRKAWKEDVLQLRTMMWFAWQSCSKMESELGQGREPGL